MKNLTITYLILLFSVLTSSAQSTLLRGEFVNFKNDYVLSLSLSNSTIKLDTIVQALQKRTLGECLQ